MEEKLRSVIAEAYALLWFDRPGDAMEILKQVLSDEEQDDARNDVESAEFDEVD
jgi:hypothetical protein